MQNPEQELKNSLEVHIHHITFLNSILNQINKYYEWLVKNGNEEIEVGGWFYYLSIYSFKRILTIDACKLLADREKTSLKKWLKDAHDNAKSLNPSYHVSRVGNQVMPTKEYKDLIAKQLEDLSQFDEIINDLLSLRDKGFAHSEKKYFNNPEKLELDYLVTRDDYNNIFDHISSIVQKHYILLFNSDRDIHLSASTDIESLLIRTRSSLRFNRNKILRDLGVNFSVFRNDKYNPDDISLKGSKIEEFITKKLP